MSEKAIWDYLLAKTRNAFSAAGIMGNLCAESSLRSDNLQNTYETSLGMTDAEYTKAVDSGAYTGEQFCTDHAGYGLAQWTYSTRKRGLYRATVSKGLSIADLHGQLDFLWHEVTDDKSLTKTLTGAQTVDEASTAFMLRFEKPADVSPENQARRARLGQKYYDRYAGGGGVITADALIAQCEIPLEQKWGYIFGAYGQIWTQEKQDAATDATIKEYGQQWVGRHVVDCSGLFYWAFHELGGWIHHGSNSIWNEDCKNDTKGTLKDGKRTDGKEVRPGSAVFLTKNENGRINRHHIGIYIGSNMCIEAKGTRSGVVASGLNHWDEVAELKDVSYDGEVIHTTLRNGCRGEEVKELQQDLIVKGYDPGTADGVFGSRTEKAVKAFQTDNGLTADGIVVPKTWAVLLEGAGMPNDKPEEEKPQEGPLEGEFVQISKKELETMYAMATELQFMLQDYMGGVG